MLKLRHTGIYVHDLERMKDFYCDNFGMQVAVHAFEKGNYIDTVLGLEKVELELYKCRFDDESMIELIHCNREVGKELRGAVYDVGCAHMGITVENVECLYERLQKEGIVFISPPTLSADGSAKVCFCKDPEGNYLELVEEKNNESSLGANSYIVGE